MLSPFFRLSLIFNYVALAFWYEQGCGLAGGFSPTVPASLTQRFGGHYSHVLDI